MDGANRIVAYTVITLAGAFIGYRLFFFRDMTFEERIPTAAGGINNPGNIEKPNGGRDTFRGEIIEDNYSRFTSFKSMAHGYRAIKKILKTKYSKGLKTLRAMIASYAPPEDGNNVEAYVQAVSNAAGVSPDVDMGTYADDLWQKVVEAIGNHEQGAAWKAQYAANISTWVNDGFLMV